MSETIPLRDLDADITRHTHEDGAQTMAVWFECPVCRDHYVMIPYADTKAPGVWACTAGSTIDDLTLTPSYRIVNDPNGCRLHGFVRDGHWENCADSRREPEAPQ